MQTTRPQGLSLALPLVRWGARILSAGILLFWGWFLIAHLLSEEGLFSRAPAPVWQDYAGLTAMVAGLWASRWRGNGNSSEDSWRLWLT